MKGVLENFQIPLDNYADDVRDIVGNCISRYGLREWKAAVMTNEIHGHLGIYSTLGAKMGLRARELFEEVGCTGEISVESFAGSVPPVSCLNDGLQISTGATMGHGLFHLAEAPQASVRARFTCEGRTLELTLKPEFEAQIREDIRQGVQSYGHTPAYWSYVRSLALQYWSSWDRTVIFTTLSGGSGGRSGA